MSRKALFTSEAISGRYELVSEICGLVASDCPPPPPPDQRTSESHIQVIVKWD